MLVVAVDEERGQEDKDDDEGEEDDSRYDHGAAQLTTQWACGRAQ